MESITHINNAFQASLNTQIQNTPVNKLDCNISVSSTKDILVDSIKENNQISIVTNFLVPLFLVYLVYLSGSKDIYTQIIKYMIIIGFLKYLYKYLKKEPHPSNKAKENGHISLMYSFIIITLLTLVDYNVINFGNINLFNVSFSVSLIFAFISILIYGYGLLYTKSYYSTDLITTLLLSYLFYRSNIFYMDTSPSAKQSLSGGAVGVVKMDNSSYKQSQYSNTEFDFA